MVSFAAYLSFRGKDGIHGEILFEIYVLRKERVIHFQQYNIMYCKWFLGLGQCRNFHVGELFESIHMCIYIYIWTCIHMYTHVYIQYQYIYIYIHRYGTIWLIYLIFSMTNWRFFVQATWILRESRWFAHKTMGTELPPKYKPYYIIQGLRHIRAV